MLPDLSTNRNPVRDIHENAPSRAQNRPDSPSGPLSRPGRTTPGSGSPEKRLYPPGQSWSPALCPMADGQHPPGVPTIAKSPTPAPMSAMPVKQSYVTLGVDSPRMGCGCYGEEKAVEHQALAGGLREGPGTCRRGENHHYRLLPPLDSGRDGPAGDARPTGLPEYPRLADSSDPILR